MGSLDTHLEADERVLFRARLHPVVFGGTLVFSAFVIGVAALIVGRNELARRSIELLWLGAVLIVAVAWVSPIVRWRTSRFVATSRRLLVTVGLARVRTVAVSCPDAGAIEVAQTVCGRWLGYGTLRLVGEDGVPHVFLRVARVDGLREAVQRQASPSSGVRAR